VLNDVITNSGETAMPNALLLPTSRFLTAEQHAAEQRQFGSLLKFIQREQQLLGDDRSAARHSPEPRT
jgi:hypothetical protein